VAKYSAEIEILVRGGKQLEAVISQVQILSAAIGKLNNTALKPADSAIRNSISGIDVYTKSLRQAEQAEKQLTRAIELRQKQLRVPSPAVPSRSGSGGGGGGGRAGGGVGKAIGGSLSSAAIGGAFPLLFGQSPQAAVGGAIGGLLGGAGGGFAGSLLGTALGELEAAKARTKELTLELGLSSTQAKTLATAFELAGRNSQQLEAAVTNIQGLGLSTKETASAIKIAVELSKEYGGSVEKIAQSFADTLESGKVSITTLNKFTAQGIPIQDELAKKFGVSRTKLLEMAKDGEISVQQLTDALVEMGREAEATADKGETGFDRFTRAVKDISTAIASAAGALLKILIPALDAVLTKLSAVINRATQAINLVTDAQVGSAESALFKVGMSQGMFGGFAQSKGNIDLLTDGLKTLKPQLATNQEELNKFAGTLQSYRTKLRQFGGETGEYAVKTAQVELSRVERDIAARATALKVDTQVPATAQITDITAPANLPPSGAATQKSTDRSKQIFEGILRLQNQIRQAYLDQAKAALQATEFSQGEAAAIELQLSKFEEIAKVRVQILDTERSLELTSAESGEQAALINKLYATKLDILAAQDALEKQQLKRKISEIAVEKELAAVQRQRDISAAKRDIRRQTFSTQLDIAAFTTSSKEIEQQRLALEQNFRWTDATREANEKIRDLKYELSNQDLDTASRDTAQLDMEAQQAKLAVIEKELSLLDQVEQKQLRLQQFFATYGQLIQSVSGEIAGAITFGVSEMIRGTKTAEEVFAQFLNSVGDALLSTAQQMIASYIAIGIAKMFAGLGGGGADPAAAGGDWISAVGRLSPNAKGNAFGANGIAPFARGGAFTNSVVSSPTMFKFADGGTTRTGLMGEAGPEAIMPLKRGPDGSLGVQANGLREAMGRPPGATSKAPVLNMKFETTSINGVEYVSRDQLESAMAVTRRQAANDGASRGMNMTLDKIQNSPSTRARVGIR
jgi:lambda family phage tail tape measure protein